MTSFPEGKHLVLLMALGIGCTEGTTEPATRVAPRPALAYSTIGPQEAPAGVPSEYTVPASLNVTADAGWDFGYAYAQALVHFTANNVIAKATLSTNEGSVSSTKRDSWVFPASRHIYADVVMPMPQCHGTITAHADGHIWNTFSWFTPSGGVSTYKWAEQQGTDVDFFECATTTTSQIGGGAGGSGSMTCYVLYIDHYYYYPDTGDIEYVGSETYQWCEPVWET